VNLFRVGTIIGIEKNLDLMSISVEFLEKAVKVSKKGKEKAEALNNLGNALSAWAELIEGKEPEEARKKYEKAIECYDKVLKINPNDTEAWNNKGNALNKLGRYKEAVESKGKAAFLLCLEGRTDFAFEIFKEVYDKRLNIPICYECGVALASLLYLRNEEYDEIVADCNRNKDKICSSAKIVLKYLIDGEIEGEIEVRDEKDAVFKVLLGKLTEME